MRVTMRSALFALLPALVHAVSLSDMTPRAQGLPDDCNDIYTSQISGCGVSDFTTSSCTDACVAALYAMVGPIKEACGGQRVTGQNLIVAFLANVGPQQICPDAAPEDGGGSSSAASQQTTPSPTPSPSPSPSPSPDPSPSPSSTTTTNQRTSATSATLLVDTSSAAASPSRTRTPAFSGTTTATALTQEQSFAPTTSVEDASTTAVGEATSTSASTGSAESATDDQSGGGSPFDNEGNMYSNGADSLGSASVLVSLGIAVVVVVFLFR